METIIEQLKKEAATRLAEAAFAERKLTILNELREQLEIIKECQSIINQINTEKPWVSIDR